MKHLQLGRNGPMPSAMGLGCMGMSDAYGPADRNEILKTLEAAAVAGINLIDTGDFYGKGRNELLIGEALKTLERETLLISVKFGAIRSPNGQWLGLDMRPKSVKNYLYYSGIEQDSLPTTRERGIGITGHMECFRELEPGTGRSASRSGHGPTSNGGTDRNSPGCGTGDRRDSTGRRAAWRLKGSAQ